MSASLTDKTAGRQRELFPTPVDAVPSTLERIVARSIHRKDRAGSVMFDAHTPCAGFPLILSGTIKVLQRYPNGRELPLYRVHPGESCLLSGSCLLGSVREIVGRLLRMFEDKGWVSLGRERVEIVDSAALAAMARA